MRSQSGSNRAVATSVASGHREVVLDLQETVACPVASGINTVVVTSRRLLGFSSRTFIWTETDRELHKNVLDRLVLANFSVVRTDKHLYGFRGANGSWGLPLYMATSLKGTGIHEHITRLDIDQGLIIVTTNKRILVFGSRLSGWEQFE